jgi:hypothetical protein
VAQLPQQHFSTLMGTLEFGLLHSDGVVAQSSLEGLAGLARFQLEQRRAGGDGLGQHAMAGGRSVGAHFLEALLRRLLLDDTPLDLAELAGDALLPLTLLEGQAFQGVCAVVAAAQEPGAQAAVLHSLARFQAAVGGVAENNRASRRLFRESLCAMVADVRGLVRVR